MNRKARKGKKAFRKWGTEGREVMRKEKEEFVFQRHLTSENTCVLLTHSEPSLHQVTQGNSAILRVFHVAQCAPSTCACLWWKSVAVHIVFMALCKQRGWWRRGDPESGVTNNVNTSVSLCSSLWRVFHSPSSQLQIPLEKIKMECWDACVALYVHGYLLTLY